MVGPQKSLYARVLWGARKEKDQVSIQEIDTAVATFQESVAKAFSDVGIPVTCSTCNQGKFAAHPHFGQRTSFDGSRWMEVWRICGYCGFRQSFTYRHWAAWYRDVCEAFNTVWDVFRKVEDRLGSYQPPPSLTKRETIERHMQRTIEMCTIRDRVDKCETCGRSESPFRKENSYSAEEDGSFACSDCYLKNFLEPVVSLLFQYGDDKI